MSGGAGGGGKVPKPLPASPFLPAPFGWPLLFLPPLSRSPFSLPLRRRGDWLCRKVGAATLLHVCEGSPHSCHRPRCCCHGAAVVVATYEGPDCLAIGVAQAGQKCDPFGRHCEQKLHHAPCCMLRLPTLRHASACAGSVDALWCPFKTLIEAAICR